MLYQERLPSRTRLFARLLAYIAYRAESRRIADLDLLSMNAHLRRDLGLTEGLGRSPHERR